VRNLKADTGEKDPTGLPFRASGGTNATDRLLKTARSSGKSTGNQGQGRRGSEVRALRRQSEHGGITYGKDKTQNIPRGGGKGRF